jgi:hypothetical protein
MKKFTIADIKPNRAKALALLKREVSVFVFDQCSR